MTRGAQTKSARARAAILEALRSGEEYTVRDFKGILRSKGIDLEATAQRIYELRRPEHGSHDIRHAMATRPGGRVHVYYLAGGAGTPSARPTPACRARPFLVAGPSDPLAAAHPGEIGWVKDRLREGDRAAIERADPSIQRLAAAIEANKDAQDTQDATSGASLSSPSCPSLFKAGQLASGSASAANMKAGPERRLDTDGASPLLPPGERPPARPRSSPSPDFSQSGLPRGDL